MQTLKHIVAMILAALVAMAALGALGPAAIAADQPLIARFLKDVPANQIVPGADGYGDFQQNAPAVAALKAGKTIGYVFLTSDFVTTTGYSGKPIHTLVGIDHDAVLTGVKLVKHSEPIVLIGIPDAKIQAVTSAYAGLDIKKEAAASGAAHDLDIISGATVTIMVIDDSIVRASLKVARRLGLGGLQEQVADGPKKAVDLDATPEVLDWQALTGDGSVRRLSLDVGQINDAFDSNADPRARRKRERGAASDTFIDLYVAPVSVPSIGRSLLGDAEYENLKNWLQEGEHAILVLGRGRYSFKGSGYVRGGIFDRIQLIQSDISVRFHDRDHRRLGEVAAEGAPSFTELDLFKIKSELGFDAADEFRLQLLVHRAVGAIEKVFLTFDLGYRTPDKYLKVVAGAQQQGAVAHSAVLNGSEQAHLWGRVWKAKQAEIAVLVVMLLALTVAFFFQMQLTRHERLTFWFRIGYLSVALVFLGWYANAQLSVVNVMAFTNAVAHSFSWDAFLMDPLVFIQWFAVAAALLFWGRGAYCGWLCPFGALQELSNRLAKLARIPQIIVPWGLHERVWPVKYVLFLTLFGLSLYSLDMAEKYAEVEPFKTAIILKFMREWPFVVFALGLLVINLFIERFYCRYLCPLGAALAIPARIRMFDWLKRYRDCGNPCARCAKECMVQAIHPEGNINPNECLQCLHCQVLYQSDDKCPVCIAKLAKRKRFEKVTGLATPVSKAAPAVKVPAE